MDNSQLYDDMSVAERNARYDNSCKKLLSHKIILAYILKYCVDEFKQCSITDIAEKYIEGAPEISETPMRPERTNRIVGDNTEDGSVNESTIYYDIKFSAIAPGESGEIGLIINIEAQNKYNNGYPLVMRGLYYLARMLSAQYGTVFTGSHYEKLRKVYSIWICMNSPTDRQNTIDEFVIDERNVFGQVKEEKRHYDLMKLVMVCLGEDSCENHELLNLLGVLFSETLRAPEKADRLEDDFGIAVRGSMKEVMDEMCNLSSGLIEKGIKKGIKEGIKEGIEKGKKIGVADGIIVCIKAVMESMNVSFDKAAQILMISDADKIKYKELMDLE